MAEKTFDVRIQTRIDTLANWESNNPRLRLGEIGIAYSLETDSETGVETMCFRMKVGTGAHDWADLPFIFYTQKEIQDMLVQDGASAAKVSFNSDKFTSKNVSGALNELFGLIKGVETSIKEQNDECYEIIYSSSKSGLTDITNAQQAFDYITDYLQNYIVDANDVVYENTVSNFKDPISGLAINDVQTAMDYLYKMIPQNASALSYSNGLSGLTAKTVQAAIDELLQNINDLEAVSIAYTEGDNIYVKGSDVQSALDNIETTINDIYSFGVSKELSSFEYDNTVTQIQIDENDATIHDKLNAQQALEYCITKFTVIKQNLNGAVSVTFDNTTTSVITGTDVQSALEQLDNKVQNNVDRLDTLTASNVKYVNGVSASTATNVQDALDSLDSRLDSSEKASGVSYDDSVSAMGSGVNTVQKAIEKLDNRLDSVESSDGIGYDDSVSLMGTASSPIDTVQKAIEKLDNRLDKTEKANGVSYEDTLYSIGETEVQGAIDNTIGRVKATEDLIADWDDGTLSKFSTNSDGDLMFGTILIGGTNTNFHQYASEISYDNEVSSLVSENVQSAIDEIDSRIDIVENADGIKYDNATSGLTASNIQDAIDELDSTLDSLELKASKVTYDNTTSGLSATYVQGAIDELDNTIDNLNASDISYREVGATSDTNVKAELDKLLSLKASDLPFDDTVTSLGDASNTVDNIQKAIEVLDSRLDINEANKNSAVDITYDDSSSNLGTDINNVQKAIEAIDSKVDTLELKAEKITYDDSVSNMILSNNTVQEAIEKIDSRIDGIEAWDSEDISYINTIGSANVTNVKDALDELSTLENSNNIKYASADTDSNKLTSTNVRDALDEVNNKLDTIAANKNTADDITYDKTKTSKSVNADTVQDAIDVLASAISTTDGKISNEAKDLKYDDSVSNMGIVPSDTTFGVTIQEAIEKLDDRLDSSENASGVKYDNSTSKLTSTTTQDAIDEVVSKLGTIELKAEKVTFTPGTGDKDLKSTEVQSALEEVNSKLDTIAANKNTANDIIFDNSNNGMSSENMQTAIEEIYGSIPNAASDIEYKNVGTTLTDDNVQDAITTLSNRTDKIPTKLEELSYNNTVKNILTATDGQTAIDELASSIDGIKDGSITINYDNTFSTLVSTTIDEAISELDDKYQQYTGAKASYVAYDPTTSGRNTVATAQGAIDKAFAEIDQINANFSDNAAGIKYNNATYPVYDTVEKALNVLFDDVLFEAPKIDSFTVTGYTISDDGCVYVEKGTSIASLVFNWTLSGVAPTQILLTGCSPTASDLSATYSTALSSDKTFKLIIEDADGNTDSKEITFKFVDKIYYGSSVEPTTYDSSFILGLSNNENSLVNTFNIKMNIASGEYGFIALPFAIEELYICNLPTTLMLCDTISFTNASSGNSTYYIYRTYQSGLGKITMELCD